MGVSVGSPTAKYSRAAGTKNVGMSPHLSLSFKVDGGVDAQIHSPACAAGHQPHSDDGRSEAGQRNHPEAERCSTVQAASGGCSHVPRGDAAAERSHQHSVELKSKKFYDKDERTEQTGLKVTEARKGMDGAPAPPQDPINMSESQEDKSWRVAAPETSHAEYIFRQQPEPNSSVFIS
ncbi:mucin-associated surface protein (MASP) [Trypanosoma cruzi]|nr:mucin-associated surface protein (MASP) [Trypanosoma cruzi]